MLRVKNMIPLFLLVIALAWPLLAAAQAPEPGAITCLPRCYVSNEVISGKPVSRNGSPAAPWVVPTPEGRETLRNNVARAVQVEGDRGYLTVIISDSPGEWYYYTYTYTPSSGEMAEEAGPTAKQSGIPPEVGVRLPFPYILGGGAVLGTLLIVAGVLLWRRGPEQLS